MTRAEPAAVLAPLDAGGAWVVGGAIRDALAGIEQDRFDLDLAVAGAEAWSRAAAEALGSVAIRLSPRFGIWRIPLRGGQLDVWELSGGQIEPDLRRRDFTVNALALPLDQFRRGDFQEGLLDLFGGRADLAARRLRLVSETALRDDPVRMLRAVRLEAEGGWRPDAALRAALRRDAAQIGESTPERCWQELRRMLVSDQLPWALRRLEQSGLLEVIFPELADCRGVDQRPAHRRDVFWHQIDAVHWLTRLTSGEPPRSRRAGAIHAALTPLRTQAGIRSALDEWRLPLRLAVLLHDIGKPATRTVGADGATHFFGHSELGAELAAQRLRELRVPEQTITQVALLIEQHLRPGQVHAPGRPPTERALHRFHTALGEAAAPLCWLFLADSLATVGAAALLPRWDAYAAHAAGILAWQPRRPQPSGALLDGHGIMAATGLPPGPIIGRIRAALDEAATVGEITSVAQAQQLAQELAVQAEADRRESVVA